MAWEATAGTGTAIPTTAGTGTAALGTVALAMAVSALDSGSVIPLDSVSGSDLAIRSSGSDLGLVTHSGVGVAGVGVAGAGDAVAGVAGDAPIPLEVAGTLGRVA